MTFHLENLNVEFISLVKSPANRKKILLKDKNARTFEIVKTDSELKRVYGIVYSPDEEDSQGDMADAGTIRKAADEFMKHGRANNVDKDHDFVAKDAFVAESWIIRKGDPMFGDESDGAWAVGIQITSEGLWKAAKDGEITGLSLAGSGSRVQKDDEPPGWFKKFFTKTEGKGEMDEEQSKELTEAIHALTAAVESTKKPEQEEEEPAGDSEEKPVEKADSFAEILEELEAARKKDMEEVQKMIADIAKKGRTDAGSTPGIESEMV